MKDTLIVKPLDIQKLNALKDFMYSNNIGFIEHKETFSIIEIDIVRFEDKIFVLNEKITLTITVNKDTFYVENNFLDILSCGNSFSEAMEAFNFSFYANIENYYFEEDNNLTHNAIKLKNKLQSLVKKIINES